MSKGQTPMWEHIVDDQTRGQIREEEMTDAEKKERERLVKGMKKSADDFEKRYPGRGKEVMYATATKMAMGEDSLSEAPETFTVMAIGDPTPSWKRSDYNYKPTAKVLDQMHSLEKSDIVHAAKMFRQKFPKATISVENKGGKIVKVFKPGEMIKEAASIRPIKVGDYVHAGLAVKGGAGFSGRVDKIDGNYVYVNVSKDKSVQFKDDPMTKWGERIIKAPIKNVSLQEAEYNTDYETYFRDMLKKHGYDSPADIPDDKKADFFNAVDKGYSAQNEAVEENDDLGMMKGQLMSIIDRATALHDRVSAKPPSNVEAWVQAKVTDADTAITALHDYFKYSDDQNPEFAVEPLAEAEVLVKGEKPISGLTLPLKKTAALAFASAFVDRPTGATPEAIVNQALAVYFQKNKVPNIVRLRNLGRMLQLVSKMGINWNEELIPPQLVRFVNAAVSPTGLPMDEATKPNARRIIEQLKKEAVQGPTSPSAMSATQRLAQQQKQEKEQMAARHQQQKLAAQQRDFQDKQRKQQAASSR